MAIQSEVFSTSFGIRTFTSTKPIATKQHMAVWIKRIIDNEWLQLSVNSFELINNSAVLTQAPDQAIYSQIEVRVADEPDELATSPNAISIVAGNIDNINVVAENIDLITTAKNGEYIVKELPTTASIGDIAVNVTDGFIYEFQVTGWVKIGEATGGTGGTSSGTNPIVPIEPSLPPSGIEGELIFNTADGLFYAYINGEWKYVSSPPSEVVGIGVYSENPTEDLYEGLVIFNTTLNQLLKYTNGSWVQVVEPTTAATEVADGSVTIAKFASGIRPIEIVDTLPTTNNVVGRLVYLTTDGKVYRYTGTGFTASIPAVDITGTIGATQIADDAITTPKIAAGAITAGEIAANTITGDKISSNTITSGLIQAGAVGASQIAAGAITTDKIYAGAVVADKIATNAIDATKIVAGAISSDKLAANSIIAGKIASGAVSTANLAAGCVTANQIAAGAITASKLSVDALDGKSGAFTGSRAYASSGYWTITAANSTTGSGNGGIHAMGSGYGVVGNATTGWGVLGYGGGDGGVRGYSTATGVGVNGESSNGFGVQGSTSRSDSQWGLYTPDKTYSAGGYSPFTGSHIVYSKDKTLKQGMVVSSNDAWCINIDQTLIHIEKAKLKAKNVVGVVSYVKNTLMDNIENNPMIKEEHKPYIDYMKNNGFFEVEINSLGEGGILVSNVNGNIDNGDYLVADGNGYAMKQDDDILHNYTVAKALESVDWSKETSTTKMISCTYHCG